MELKVELWAEYMGQDCVEEFSEEELADDDKMKAGIKEIVDASGDLNITYILSDPETGEEVKRGRFDL